MKPVLLAMCLVALAAAWASAVRDVRAVSPCPAPCWKVAPKGGP